VIVHAAIGGSTNTIMHLMALAYEAGVDLPLRIFDELNRDIPFLVNCRPSGTHPVNLLWYAGGTQWLIRELREYLHMDTMTVTGRTLEENLREVEASGFFDRNRLYLRNFGVEPEDIIRPRGEPLGTGSLAVLYGSLAPDGAVVKTGALPRGFETFTGEAIVFESTEEAIEAVFDGRIKPGHVVVIRYEGPASNGMPEQYYITEAIVTRPDLAEGIALVTDGRFSGATRGPAIGHVSPEAMAGGPIAIVQNGDRIRIDVPRRRLDLLVEEDVMQERMQGWERPSPRFDRGLLAVYTRLALSADRGARMDYEGIAAPGR
jgi:dihydroxy-acid dehydratase